jgi:CheY-like chemotaxis protein
MTLLYVDDDIEDQEIFQEAVSSINPQVICHLANDGKEALKVLENLIILPQYLFVDINMPVMNGMEFLKEVKQNSLLREIPVIVYSTSNNPKDLDECLKLGAIDFVQKPNSLKKVFESLRPWIDQRT